MGASGSAWIKPKKRRGLRAEPLSNLPHPRFAREGQRYYPLTSRAANVVTLKLVRAVADRCELKREDSDERRVRVTTERLLQAGQDGLGVHYRFVGFAPRSGYATHAVVVEAGASFARLVVPEWHPGLSVPVATGSLPRELRAPGAWLACRADLGADAGARVQPHAFAPVAATFDPARHHAVTVPAPEPGDADGAADRGDVVLFLSQAALDDAATGTDGVYLTGHPPRVRPGARAYLHAGGAVQGWRAVRAVRPLPSGTRVVLGGPWRPAAVDADVKLPPSAVVSGRHGQQSWIPCDFRGAP
jgi:hypothetical protein